MSKTSKQTDTKNKTTEMGDVTCSEQGFCLRQRISTYTEIYTEKIRSQYNEKTALVIESELYRETISPKFQTAKEFTEAQLEEVLKKAKEMAKSAASKSKQVYSEKVVPFWNETVVPTASQKWAEAKEYSQSELFPALKEYSLIVYQKSCELIVVAKERVILVSKEAFEAAKKSASGVAVEKYYSEQVQPKMEEMKKKAGQKIEEVKSKSVQLKEKALDLKSQGFEKVDELKLKASEKTEELKQKVDELKVKATEKFDEVKEKSTPYVEQATEKYNIAKEKALELKEKAVELKDKSTPYYESAKEKAAPYYESAKERVTEKLSPYVEEMKKKGEEMQVNATEQATSKYAEMKEKASLKYNENVTPYVESAKEKAEELKGQLEEKVESVKTQVNEKVEEVKQNEKFIALQAKYEEVKEKSAPYVQEMKEKTQETVEKTVESVKSTETFKNSSEKIEKVLETTVNTVKSFGKAVGKNTVKVIKFVGKKTLGVQKLKSLTRAFKQNIVSPIAKFTGTEECVKQMCRLSDPVAEDAEIVRVLCFHGLGTNMRLLDYQIESSVLGTQVFEKVSGYNSEKVEEIENLRKQQRSELYSDFEFGSDEKVMHAFYIVREDASEKEGETNVTNVTKPQATKLFEFVLLNAPKLLSKKERALQVDPRVRERYGDDLNAYRRWFRINPLEMEISEVEECIAYIEDFVSKEEQTMGSKFEHVLGFSQGGFLIELLLGLRGEKNLLDKEFDCDSDSFDQEADASTCAPDTPRDPAEVAEVESNDENNANGDNIAAASAVLKQIYKRAQEMARAEATAATTEEATQEDEVNDCSPKSSKTTASQKIRNAYTDLAEKTSCFNNVKTAMCFSSGSIATWWKPAAEHFKSSQKSTSTEGFGSDSESKGSKSERSDSKSDAQKLRELLQLNANANQAKNSGVDCLFFCNKDDRLVPAEDVTKPTAKLMGAEVVEEETGGHRMARKAIQEGNLKKVRDFVGRW